MLQTSRPRHRSSEAGFTLVEALVAMLVLAVGITAVANLMLVGASNNTVGNAATASAAIAAAQLELLKGTEYTQLAALAPGGDLDDPIPPTGFFRDDDLPGVGRVHTRWTVQAVPGTAQGLLVTVRSEGTGAMTRARSRAQFSVVRSCTSTTIGCPP